MWMMVLGLLADMLSLIQTCISPRINWKAVFFHHTVVFLVLVHGSGEKSVETYHKCPLPVCMFSPCMCTGFLWAFPPSPKTCLIGVNVSVCGCVGFQWAGKQSRPCLHLTVGGIGSSNLGIPKGSQDVWKTDGWMEFLWVMNCHE